MKMEFWYLVLGGLLVVAALLTSPLKRWPLTPTMLYLGFGILLGPLVFSTIKIHPLLHTEVLERAAELAVIVSLFTAGLKLRTPFRHGKWTIPIRLAFISMTLTVGMVAVVGVVGFGLPLGAAILLGAVLAPTDPVMASAVQLESAADRDKLRFSLTGEAGLNDGTAFPFVMLGVGVLGLHEIGDWGWRWFTIDVLWAITGGLAIGALLGIAVGRVVLYLRRDDRERVGHEEFLTLGLIGISYGAALIAHTYGFLAVFAAGLALRKMEYRETEAKSTESSIPDTGSKTVSLRLAESVLNFNERIERILEVALVLVIGIMLTPEFLNLNDLWFVPILFLIIRPVAVVVGLIGGGVSRTQLSLISWFGIRGIGSIYYLTHGIGYGVASDTARQLISITLWVIASSVVIHGISVTPLMSWYQLNRRGQVAAAPGSSNE